MNRPNHHVPLVFTSPRPAVLLAEDDTELRSLIAEALREVGCEVTEASDGGRLLVQVLAGYGHSAQPRDAYNLIISDICMPICTGLEILEGVRQAHWHTPVILMTAFGDPWMRKRAERLGAIVFDKPFEIDDLETAVVHLLRPPPKR
jgi:CheY-like chemotaxis protein